MNTSIKHESTAGVQNAKKERPEIYSWYDHEKVKRLTTVLLGLIIAGYLLILKIPVYPSQTDHTENDPQVTSDTKMMAPDEVLSKR